MKAQELKNAIADGEKIHIIDVREREEIQGGDMLSGAENVPVAELLAKAENGELSKEERIVTVCKAGTRCQIVAKELAEKGYQIDFLEGGMKSMNE